MSPMDTLATTLEPSPLPVGQLDATQRGGAVAAHEQPEVAVCRDTWEGGG